jgi:hypothetical protein
MGLSMPPGAPMDDPRPMADRRQMVFPFPFSMRPGAIIGDVSDTIMMWQREGLTAPQLWLLLRGEERNFVTWAQVEDFMIGWQQGQVRSRRVA